MDHFLEDHIPSYQMGITVLFVQLLIRPLMTKVSAAKEQLEVLNQQYSDLLLQSQSYDQNIASLKDWKEKNGEETKKLFPLSDAERIDRFLTFVMNEAGVTVDGLNIGQTMADIIFRWSAMHRILMNSVRMYMWVELHRRRLLPKKKRYSVKRWRPYLIFRLSDWIL